MSLLQIFAFLSVLTAFNIPQSTINQIHDILIPVEASTTPTVISPVAIAPIQQNQPIYFGSTPVVDTHKVAPVVESKVMEDKSGIFLTDVTADHPAHYDNQRFIKVVIKDVSGEIVRDFNKTYTIKVDGVFVQAGTDTNGPVYDIPTSNPVYPVIGNDSVIEVTFEGKTVTL